MADEEKIMKFFRPEDFETTAMAIKMAGLPQALERNIRFQAAAAANAKLEADFGNEYSIVMFWKEKMLEERTKADRLEMLLCEFLAESGCGYCNDCVPCGSGYSRIKEKIKAELAK